MIRLIVDKASAKEISGVSKAGKDYKLQFQTVHAFCVDPDTGEVGTYPDKFELVLPRERDGKPYPKGEYVLSPASIYVDRDGRLALRPLLVARAGSAPAK